MHTHLVSRRSELRKLKEVAANVASHVVVLEVLQRLCDYMPVNTTIKKIVAVLTNICAENRITVWDFVAACDPE